MVNCCNANDSENPKYFLKSRHRGPPLPPPQIPTWTVSPWEFDNPVYCEYVMVYIIQFVISTQVQFHLKVWNFSLLHLMGDYAETTTYHNAIKPNQKKTSIQCWTPPKHPNGMWPTQLPAQCGYWGKAEGACCWPVTSRLTGEALYAFMAV